jgi:hypothetical protein
MLPEFNYILVSDEDNGTQFSNICNQELNFQDGEPYEVCMQDMIYPIGAWDNVREGGNTITVAYENEPVRVLHLATGRYTSKEMLINHINNRFETLYNDGNYLSFLVRPAVAAESVRYWRHTGAAKYEIKYCIPAVQYKPNLNILSCAT